MMYLRNIAVYKTHFYQEILRHNFSIVEIKQENFFHKSQHDSNSVLPKDIRGKVK